MALDEPLVEMADMFLSGTGSPGPSTITRDVKDAFQLTRASLRDSLSVSPFFRILQLTDPMFAGNRLRKTPSL